MDNLVIDTHGNKWWHDSDGNIHRTDGPAIIYADGDCEWYQHGLRHRDNGPALEYASGSKSWYLHGEYLSFEEWLDEVNISDEDKVMMKLKYG
jgi:hypothetical protein